MPCRSVWTEACLGKRLLKSLTHSATQKKAFTSPTRWGFEAESKHCLTFPHLHSASFMISTIKIRTREGNGVNLSSLLLEHSVWTNVWTGNKNKWHISVQGSLYSKGLVADCEICFLSPMQLRGSHPCVLLAELGRGHNLTLYKPNVGKQKQPENLEKIQKKYRKVCPCPFLLWPDLFKLVLHGWV